MPQTDEQRLIYQLDANVTRLTSQVQKAMDALDGGSAKMERRAEQAKAKIERAFGSIKLENSIDVARAAGDRKRVEVLEEQLALERQIARARAAGLGEGEAKEYAESHLKSLAMARKSGMFGGSGNIGEAIEGTLSRSRLAVLEEGGAKIPIFGGALEALGPAGLTAAAGLFAAAEAAEQVKKATEEIGALKIRADRLGLPVSALQELEFAAKRSHVPVEQLDDSLQNLSGTLGKLQSGVGAAKTQKLADFLGFSPADLAQYHDAADFLPALAEKIRALPNLSEQVMAAQRFGVLPLLPLLLKGKEGVAELTEAYRRLGIEVSDEFASKIAEGNEALETAAETAHGNLRNALAQLQPLIVSVGTAWDNAASKALVALSKMGTVVSNILAQRAELAKQGGGPGPGDKALYAEGQGTLGLLKEFGLSAIGMGFRPGSISLPKAWTDRLGKAFDTVTTPTPTPEPKGGSRRGKAAPTAAQIANATAAADETAGLEAEYLDHAKHRLEMQKKIADIEQKQGHAMDAQLKAKLLAAASAEDAKPGRHKADEAAHKADESSDKIDGLVAELISRTSKSHDVEDAIANYAKAHGGAEPAQASELRAAAAEKDAEPARQRDKRAEDDIDKAQEDMARAVLEGAQYARDKSDAIQRSADFEVQELQRQAARRDDELQAQTKGPDPQLDRFQAMQVSAAEGAVELQREANARAKERQQLADRQFETDQQQARAGESLLQAQLGLATTAAARKRLSENLLALQQQAERDALEHELTTTPGVDPDGAYARLRRKSLADTQAAQTTALGRQNAGPLADLGRQMQADTDEPGQKLAVQAINQMNEALEQGLTNWKNMGQAAKSALKGIIGDLLKLSLEKVELSASSALGGMFSAGASSAGSWLSGLWGGAHANGGTIPAGKVGLVGERGPELAIGGAGGTNVVPNSILSAIGGMAPVGASSTTTNALTIHEHYDLAGAVSEGQVKGWIAQGRAQTLAEATRAFRSGFGTQMDSYQALEA